MPRYNLSIVYSSAVLLLYLPREDMTLHLPPPPQSPKLQYPPHYMVWTRHTIKKNEMRRGRIDLLDIVVPELATIPPPSHDEIATAAYYRWLARGAPASPEDADEDWLDAEQELLWKQVKPLPPPSHDEIATAAYYRWLARGAPASPEGADEDWRQANNALWEQVVERSV
jgi:hypothetical protein